MSDKIFDDAVKDLSSEAIKTAALVAGINAVLQIFAAVIAFVIGLLILGLAPEGLTKYVAMVTCWLIGGRLLMKSDRTSDIYLKLLPRIK